MPFLDVSSDDIQRGKLLTPDWYRVRIDSVEESLSKNGDSKNIILKGRILFNANDGSEEFKDVPIPYWNFNSKAPGFAIGFMNAIGHPVDHAGRIDLSLAEGKEVDVFITNELYNNSMVNRVNHRYRAPRSNL